MTLLKEEKNIYLSNFAQFEKSLPVRDGHSWLHGIRKAALRRFSELGFPTTRNEDWKFTNVEPIAKIPFQTMLSYDPNGETLDWIERASYALPDCIRLVFVNGFFSAELSTPPYNQGGAIVTSLANALAIHSDRIEPYLARYADFDNHAFTALNTAFIRDGAFISVPKGQSIDRPIHFIFAAVSRGEGCVTHPRNLILAGPHSKLTVVETYVGLEEEAYFTNAVTEMLAAEGANIDHCKILRESEEAFHVATTRLHQARGSKVASQFVSLGGSLVRNEARAVLDDEGCECTLNGLYLARDQQHIDNHTVIDHAKPNCTSHELYKGILDGRAHGVFNGKIFVRQDAQKTDAKQTNQTLLLSEDAVINTKPQLEIYADDVKCTHGATVGQLQDEAIFYLRSRGIGEREAKSLLTFAFANDIIGRLPVSALRSHLEDYLLSQQHLPQADNVMEAP
jgi:Fe-S cluster assembly protein SufD